MLRGSPALGLCVSVCVWVEHVCALAPKASCWLFWGSDRGEGAAPGSLEKDCPARLSLQSPAGYPWGTLGLGTRPLGRSLEPGHPQLHVPPCALPCHSQIHLWRGNQAPPLLLAVGNSFFPSGCLCLGPEVELSPVLALHRYGPGLPCRVAHPRGPERPSLHQGVPRHHSLLLREAVLDRGPLEGAQLALRRSSPGQPSQPP